MALYYKKTGKGPALILIHGLFGSSDNWMQLAKDLSGRFEIFMPDMRNHGRSPHYSIMNYYAMAEDISEFMQTHKIENAIVAGHSMGGKAAMQTAFDFPHLVNKLIVIDMGIKKYPVRHIHYINTMLEVDFDKYKKRKEIEDYFMEHINDLRVSQMLLKNLEWKNKNRLGWRINIEAVNENIDAILDAVDINGTFEKPTFFIKGSLSDYILDEDEESIRKIFPNMHMASVPQAGHWVFTDNYKDFLITFEGFLS